MVVYWKSIKEDSWEMVIISISSKINVDDTNKLIYNNIIKN